jgi:phosphate transport system permease protein
VSKLSFRHQDQLNLLFLRSLALGVICLLILVISLLFIEAYPALKEFRFSFISESYWDPAADIYGGLAFIFGTLVTAFTAVLIAAPISVCIALFINEILPPKMASILGLFVEMIAAIPSIVFGLWGLFYLAPWVQQSLTPFLRSTLGFLPFFQGPSFGIGMLTASLILSLMIVPTISSICREVFKTIPRHQKEAALALGATRFEALKLAVLSPSFSGIVGATALGLGRALGETMAVAMVIGNSPQITASLFAPGSTMASVIANEYAEADSEMHVAALCLIALVLFIVTFVVNFAARAIVWRTERRLKRQA